jgi:hypothetical protein
MARSFSRLQRLEEKRNLRKAVWLILGTIGLAVLTVTLGFNLLTKLFIFMGNVNSTNKPVQKTDFIPPSPPDFLSTFDATNSAAMTLQGTAEPGSTVYLTQNGNTAGNVVTTDDGSFEFGNIRLTVGNNIFSAVAIDGSGNKSQVSDQLSVTYSNKAPSLTVNTPVDKQVVTGSDPKIQVKGTTDADNRLTINDRVIIVAGDGSFTYSMVLNQGDNPINVITTDETGNTTQKQLTVTYNP